MTDAFHPIHNSIVRIRDANGTIIGAGFLATRNLVCTCAHVVADALHVQNGTEPPLEQEVLLDFPFLDGAERMARVAQWVWMEPDDGGGDIAILRLTADPPTSARSARLLPASILSGNAFVAYGFPSDTDVGQFAYGLLRDHLANGYVQVEGTTTQGYRIQSGYSGTPVWDQQRRGVVGMVVAEDRSPDVKVAFLIPNELIFQVCSEIKPIKLHQMFSSLTDGLIGLPGSPLGGIEQFLRTYLGTFEMSTPFGGRQVQLAELDRWLATPGQPYALLVAEAGRGKSALLAQWVATVADERRADVAFVPISMRFGTSLKSTVLSILGARLRHIHHVRANLPREVEGWLAEIEGYLREDHSTGSPLLIVLDGVDEAADWMAGYDLRFPLEPGNGVKVLVSARPLVNCDAQGWLRRLEWQGIGIRVELPLLKRRHVTEVLQSMGNPLAGLGTQVDVVSELHRLSRGEPLLIRLYVEALRATNEGPALLSLEDLRALKPGLQAYFDQWWSDQHHIWGTSVPLKEQAVRSLLNLLACALGPLSIDDLLALMEPESFDSWTVKEALQPLARFVVGDGKEQGYVFSHPQLNQYFYEKLAQRERQNWEQRFLDYGRQTLAALITGARHLGEVSSYPIRFYGVHLERTGAHLDRFDELVCEGWQRAWEALEGTYNGFHNDVIRAWRLADEVGAQAQSMQERSRAISCQCRYALIVSSINSLVGNIPPGLLAALVGKGIWTPMQGVASARQILQEERRAQAFAGLAPHLPAPLLQEALETTRTIPDVRKRAEVLTSLAPHLPAPLLQEALEAARAIPYKAIRAEALMGLAPHFAESLRATVWQEALEAVQAISNVDYRVGMLASLAPHLAEPLRATVLREALEARRSLKDEWGTWALEQLVQCLGELGYGEEALKIARAITHETSQVVALVGLAPYLSASLLQEVLKTAQACTDTETRVWALVSLIPYIAESLQAIVWQEVLEVARPKSGPTSPMRLADIAQRLGKLGYREEALEVARTITDKESRAEALMGLVPHLAEPLQAIVRQEALEAARAIPFQPTKFVVWGDAPETIRTIPFQEKRVEALVRLTPHLPESLQTIVLQEALETTRITGDENSRVNTLVGLAPHLSAPLLQKVLEAVYTMSDEWKRASALMKLTPYLSAPLLQEVLEAIHTTGDEGSQTWVLGSLAQRWGELGYGEKALETAQEVRDAESRVEMLIRLAPHLTEPLQAIVWQEALGTARAVSDEENRANVLIRLAPHLTEPLQTIVWQEALEAVRMVTIVWKRGELLMWVAPHLAEPLQVSVWREVLKDASAVTIVWRQAGMRARGVQGLGELGYGEEALGAARAITHEWRRAEVLMKLAPHLAEPLQAIVWQEALEAARVINEEKRAEMTKDREDSLHDIFGMNYVQAANDITSRVMTFVGLAPHLSASLLQEALEAALAVGNEQKRTWVLERLLPHLSAPLLQEVLESVRAMRDEKNQGEVLVSLVQRLGELGYREEALKVARTITHEWSRATALTSLTPHLKEPLLQEALEIAHTITHDWRRAEVLMSLSPHLAEPLQALVLQEALEAARVMRDDEKRAEMMESLAPHLMQLPVVRLYPLWCESLRILVTRSRPSLLSDIQALVPLMAILGEEVPVATMQAIIEVGKWFP